MDGEGYWDFFYVLVVVFPLQYTSFRTHSDPGIHASVTHPNQIGFVSGVQQTYAPPTPPQNNSSPGISSGKGIFQAISYCNAVCFI